MKTFLLGLVLAAMLVTPLTSEAQLFRRRARAAVAAPARRVIVARPRIVARAPGRRFLFFLPRVGVARGAVRLRGR